MKLLRGGLHQGAAQKILRQKCAQTNRRVDDSGNQRCRASVDLRYHHDFEILRFPGNVGAALHQHSGIHAFHLQVVGTGHALTDGDVAAHKVKRKTFRKHVPEIQRQTARKGLQTQHAQQLGKARVGF